LGGDMTEEIQALSAEGDRFCLHINRPLSEVAALVRHSAVVIANDCGPVHFAHIYDVPRVIVYTAEASRDHWYRDSLRSIRLASDGSGGIYAVDPDAILAAAVSLYHDNCFE